MLSTNNQKGAVAELEIAVAAARLGIPVLKPLSEHGRSDLALEVGHRLWRVQCKWGRLNESRDVVIVKLGGSRCSPTGYGRTTYSEHEVDFIGAYCGELDRAFLLPIALCADRAEIWLRLSAPRNNQRACINLARHFDFPGAIAQLGERVTGSHEVAGSNPASSTSPPETIVIGSSAFRDRLGYWMDRVAAGDDVLITRHGKSRVRLCPAGRPP